MITSQKIRILQTEGSETIILQSTESSVTLIRSSLYAALVHRQYATFPRLRDGFNSRKPHETAYKN